MGSAVLNKSPSSFIAFVYGFLLISFLLNIPHAQGAVRVYSRRSRSLGVNDKASRVGAPPAKHDSNAQRRPPNKGVGNGASSVHGSTQGHAPSAVKQGSPPNSANAGKSAERCSTASGQPTHNRGCVNI